MQAAIQVEPIAAVRIMGEAGPTAEPHNRRNSPEELHRSRQTGPMLSQLAFDWTVPDRYVELLNLETHVADMLQMKVYGLNDK